MAADSATGAAGSERGGLRGRHADPALLASLASLKLRARWLVEGLVSGGHASAYQGQAVEFAQHRPYAPGDDLRHLDWRVFGRSDKLHVKRYQRETNLPLWLAVDVSGSMRHRVELAGAGGSAGGSAGGRRRAGRRQRSGWSKYDAAAVIASAIGYLAIQQRDRVGLMRFDRRLEVAAGPSNASGQWDRLLHQLETIGVEASGKPEADAGTDLTRVLSELAARLDRRSMVVLISDLLDDPDALQRGLVQLRRSGHDVLVLQTLDGAELDFELSGWARLTGLEGEASRVVDAASLREAYREVASEHQQKVSRGVLGLGFEHALVRVNEPLAPPVAAVLARRAGMGARQGAGAGAGMRGGEHGAGWSGGDG